MKISLSLIHWNIYYNCISTTYDSPLVYVRRLGINSPSKNLSSTNEKYNNTNVTQV